MKAAQKPCIFLENAVCLLVPNETDNGACLTVTRFPQGHIAQKFRDLTKRSLFCVRSSFEPQAHDSLGISALSGSWESRLVWMRSSTPSGGNRLSLSPSRRSSYAYAACASRKCRRDQPS